MGQVVTWEQLLPKLNVIRENKEIVFTNGCFDILHVGHVRYLQDAKALGDILVVAINTDSSVKRLKGSERPIQSETDRAEVLAALECVDYVTFFSEDTPLNLIKLINPNTLVKGGDWPTEKIVGHEVVLANGGNVKSLPFHEGQSTTEILKKIKSFG